MPRLGRPLGLRPQSMNMAHSGQWRQRGFDAGGQATLERYGRPPVHWSKDPKRQSQDIKQPDTGIVDTPKAGFEGGVIDPAHQVKLAEGGDADGSNNGHVPIIAAGGEYIIHPDVVRDIGHGSLTAGHKVLDKFVLNVRKNNINTLKKLPGPKK